MWLPSFVCLLFPLFAHRTRVFFVVVASCYAHRLLKRLRVTLQEPALGEVVAVLDSKNKQLFSFENIVASALSTVEEKKVCMYNI